METKKYLYAAVGAPVVVAKAAQEKAGAIKTKVGERASGMSKDLGEQVEAWATEGESLVSRLGETKAIDELTERMDLDQVQEQVSKLRDQLEDLLETWRSNFRPGTAPVEKIEVEESEGAEEKAEEKEPAAKKPADKKTTTTAAKKPAAKKTTTTKAS